MKDPRPWTFPHLFIGSLHAALPSSWSWDSMFSQELGEKAVYLRILEVIWSHVEVLWPTSFSLWVRAVRAESRNGLHPLITGGSLIWNLRSPPNLPIFSLTLDIGLASVDLCI
jgi:hypothetical protein